MKRLLMLAGFALLCALFGAAVCIAYLQAHPEAASYYRICQEGC